LSMSNRLFQRCSSCAHSPRRLSTLCQSTASACARQREARDVVKPICCTTRLIFIYSLSFVYVGVVLKGRRRSTDYTSLPSSPESQSALYRLPPLIEARKQQETDEMMGKLKELGNSVLGTLLIQFTAHIFISRLGRPQGNSGFRRTTSSLSRMRRVAATRWILLDDLSVWTGKQGWAPKPRVTYGFILFST
jgi:hypothetical protein